MEITLDGSNWKTEADFIVRMPMSPTSEVEEAVRYFMARVSDWRAEGAPLSARFA